MIHLDTHVVVWIAAGETSRLHPHARRMIDGTPALYSPMVRLEMQLLHEIGRLAKPPAEVLDDLETQLGLRQAPADLERVVGYSLALSWTRDPFDRMIAAHALADDVPLVTADRRLRERLPVATWDGQA